MSLEHWYFGHCFVFRASGFEFLDRKNRVFGQALNKLKKVSSKAWEKVISKNDIDIPKTTRQLQNKIFKNRKNSPLIFDWFYNFHRKSLENEMNYSVEQLVAQYIDANK